MKSYQKKIYPREQAKESRAFGRWKVSGSSLVIGLALAFSWLNPTSAHATWSPGLASGGVYQPNFQTNTSSGGSLVQIDVGYLWEWKHVALLLSLPIETDFRSRLSVGPQLRVEFSRYFRLLAAPLVDIPLLQQTPYSFFSFRSGVEAGFRTYGLQAKKDKYKTPIKAGFYLFLYVDARIPNPGQAAGRELRISTGLRLEVGL